MCCVLHSICENKDGALLRPGSQVWGYFQDGGLEQLPPKWQLLEFDIFCKKG